MLELEKLCDRDGVFVTYKPLARERKQNGMFFRAECGAPCIILDTELKRNERLGRSVLAEEYGHFKTTAASNIFEIHFSYDNSINMCKTEELALRWATDYHMPLEELAAAIRKGCKDVYELSEHFFVTEWLVWRKLHFLKKDIHKSQKVRIKVRDLFSPSLVEDLWGLVIPPVH